MSSIKLILVSHQTQDGLLYQHLRIQLTTEHGIIRPSDLKNLKLPPKIDYTQGIVLEGKAPIWLYSYLVHECHPASWVGCYDPRLGVIVIATHNPDIFVSQVFKIDLPNVTP